MSILGAILAVIVVIILIVVVVYIYNRYACTSATPERDLTRAREAVMGSVEEFQEAYADDDVMNAQMSYSKKGGAARYPKAATAYSSKKDASAKAAYSKQDGAWNKKSSMAQKRPTMNASADPEMMVDGMRDVWAQMGQEIENLDVDCAPPQQMMQLKQRLMSEKDNLSEMNKSCMRKSNNGDRVRGRQANGGADRAYGRRTSRSRNPQLSRGGAIGQINCDDFGYDEGGHCLQDTPAGPKCFRSGNNRDGSGGWYEEADMAMCDGQPSCGDVMRRCNGYDPTDY
jgi:hypothetical protein